MSSSAVVPGSSSSQPHSTEDEDEEEGSCSGSGSVCDDMDFDANCGLRRGCDVAGGGDGAPHAHRQRHAPSASTDARRTAEAHTRRRVMFLEGEMEKLLEFGQQCSQAIAEELQTLLCRFECQKGALERLMKSHEDSHDAVGGCCWPSHEEPVGLGEDSAKIYLLKVRQVMQEFSRVVCQSSLKSVPAASACRAAKLAGGRRRNREASRPVRIFDGLEALDIALVVNPGGELHYREDCGLTRLRAGAASEPGWSQLPEQTLYCAVSYARQIVVIDTAGQRLTAFGIDASTISGGQTRKTENFERVSYMRDSAGLIVSDYHSLYMCDLCGRVQNSLHTFGWIVGHCVDEASRRLYIVDRVNEYVSVYCLDSLEEKQGLVHKGFTEGISSVCLLHQQLLVSDRGANKIFAFSSDTLSLLFQVTMRCPLFLTTDFHRFVYVTVGGRDNTVKILDCRGRLHRRLGQFGSPGGLSVAVDCSELFVCDLDNRRIQVFKL